MQERKQFRSKDSKGAYFGTHLRHKTKKQLSNEWAWLPAWLLIGWVMTFANIVFRDIICFPPCFLHVTC